LFLPIENWWRASFNNWFFSKACWNQRINTKQLLREYCTHYYGEPAREIEEVFNIIFTEYQPEPYISPLEINSFGIENKRFVAEKILKKLEIITDKTTDTDVRKRIDRIKTYVEFSLLHSEAFASLEKKDLRKLVDYSSKHRDQEMVLMYPDYVEYRNKNNFGY